MILGKLGTAPQLYVPWMQASYTMVANKQALPYLPSGADINALSLSLSDLRLRVIAPAGN